MRFLAAAVALVASFVIEPRPLELATSGSLSDDGPWAGRLSVKADQLGFVDGAGAWQLPLCAHFGEAFSAYVHNKTVENISVEEQLRRIKAAGYDCVRSWINLGFYQDGWKGREVTPFSFVGNDGTRVQATAQYYDRLIAFLRLLDTLGLRLHLTQGDLNQVDAAAVRVHYQRIAELLDTHGLQHVIALVEAINENHMNGAFGLETLREWVEPFRARGYIVAATCGCSDDPHELIDNARAFSVRYYHGYRLGSATDRLRHIFTTSYGAPAGAPRLAWEGEPIGPNNVPGRGVYGNHTEDAEELGLLAVQRLIARGVWTYMSQCGVFWRCRIDRHTGFSLVPKMRKALRDFAPDVMAWPTLVHGGRPEAALVSPIGYHGDGGASEGPARIDQAISADRRKAVAVVYGGRGRKPVQNKMNCTARLTVVQPKDDETIVSRTFTLAPGETLELNYRMGRMLLAECQ